MADAWQKTETVTQILHLLENLLRGGGAQKNPAEGGGSGGGGLRAFLISFVDFWTRLTKDDLQEFAGLLGGLTRDELKKVSTKMEELKKKGGENGVELVKKLISFVVNSATAADNKNFKTADTPPTNQGSTTEEDQRIGLLRTMIGLSVDQIEALVTAGSDGEPDLKEQIKSGAVGFAKGLADSSAEKSLWRNILDMCWPFKRRKK